MDLEVKILSDNAKMPTRANAGDAGLDLYTTSSVTLVPGYGTVLGTGIAIAIPSGYYGQIKPRSSSFKKGLLIEGTIDAGYRGEIGIMVKNIGSEPVNIEAGERIAQMVISPCLLMEPVKVDTLSNSERGDNGFGSTGR